jgi:hypothetical protein
MKSLAMKLICKDNFKTWDGHFPQPTATAVTDMDEGFMMMI